MHSLRLLWAAHNEEIWLRRHKRNISRQCLEQINEMPDLLFRERFRLDKQTFYKLCQDLRVHTSLRGTREISLEVKVDNITVLLYNSVRFIWGSRLESSSNIFFPLF